LLAYRQNRTVTSGTFKTYSYWIMLKK